MTLPKLSPVGHRRLPAWATLWAVVALLRPHHWSKNVLLVLPLFLAHESTKPDKLWQALLAIVSFSAVASAGYIWNDWCDRSYDQLHRSKSCRSLATGSVSPNVALLVLVFLLMVSLLVGLTLPPRFLMVTLIYLALTVAYSLWLKRLPVWDVMLLASFYTVRLIAGGYATNTPVSAWLLTFAMFFFASLAFAKRYVELDQAGLDSTETIRGRGYRASDLSYLASTGPACGYLSVLVLALYVNGLAAPELYRRPQLLWLICPVVFYWVSRLWLRTKRGELHDDPVVFAATDAVSWIAAAMCGVFVLAAS